MNATAPQTVAPAADQYQTIQKPLPAVSPRGHEAGFHRVHYDFNGSGVNPADLCTFLQSNFFPDFILIFPFFFFIFLK
jgi:hypothetical protein